MKKDIIVIGHKNPDTDSICSAIAYAELKNKTNKELHYVPRRAGKISEETRYVLDYFKVQAPHFADTLEPRVSDVDMRYTEGISEDTSLYKAWVRMDEEMLPTLPIIDNGKLVGMITQGDLARTSMEPHASTTLSASRVKCRNIVETLAGELVTGDPDRVFDKGEVIIGASNDEIVSQLVENHSLVILGNRSGAMLSAIESGAEWLVICLTKGEVISKLIKSLAEENGCTIIVTPYDTFTVARLINQSMPVGQVMRESNLVTFHDRELVSDIKQIMTKKRLRYFPVLDKNDNYVALISQRNILDMEAQKVILVDHNEQTQAVDGIDSCEIVEIIDHHRIGSIQTMQPISFRNMPLGCTATIITMMYHEEDIEIPPKIAGLLCAAILSDTLCFRSPTCTPVDRRIAKELADTAGIDCETFATEMFRAGSRHDDQTEEEIFYADFKTFNSEDKKIGISQVNVIGESDTDVLSGRMKPYLKEVMQTTHLDMVLLMLTDVMTESSRLLFLGEGVDEIVHSAFKVTTHDNEAFLPGIVSRKKQTMPYILKAMQNMGDQLTDE